jgi:hypothetical protein
MADAGEPQPQPQQQRIANTVLYQPVLIAFPGAFALAKGLQGLLSLLGGPPVIWGLIAGAILSALIYGWDQVSAKQSEWQTFALNTLILSLTVTGFVSIEAVQGLTQAE